MNVHMQNMALIVVEARKMRMPIHENDDAPATCMDANYSI